MKAIQGVEYKDNMHNTLHNQRLRYMHAETVGAIALSALPKIVKFLWFSALRPFQLPASVQRYYNRSPSMGSGEGI